MKAQRFQMMVFVLLLALGGCGFPIPNFIIKPADSDQTSIAHIEAMPSPTTAPTQDPPKVYWPTKGWRASTPEEQGMDSARLGKLVAMLNKSWHSYDSVLVIRHGYLILEMYRNGSNADKQVNVNQVTQSVLSILFGITSAEHKVALTDKMLDYFPGVPITTNLALKQRITLENLLAHTTGMDLRRWDVLTGPHEESENWVQYALNIPAVGEPGQAVDASSATSHILAGVLRKAIAGDLMDYATAKLFAPLGISDVGWDEVPPGIQRGDGGLLITPRDMAKIGYLYLHEGQWDGQKIVSADWVKKSTCQVLGDQEIDHDKNNVMCYDWFYANQNSGIFSTRYPRFMAWGSGGQSIIVVPDKDIVVVTTGHSDLDCILMTVMADSFVVTAIESDTALPPNPDAYAQLQEKIKALK